MSICFIYHRKNRSIFCSMCFGGCNALPRSSCSGNLTHIIIIAISLYLCKISVFIFLLSLWIAPVTYPYFPFIFFSFSVRDVYANRAYVRVGWVSACVSLIMSTWLVVSASSCVYVERCCSCCDCRLFSSSLGRSLSFLFSLILQSYFLRTLLESNNICSKCNLPPTCVYCRN